MVTKTWAIGLMVLTTLFTSVAQVLYKFGVKSLEFNVIALITNWYLVGGIMLYIFGAVLMITAFRGGEVSVLYPVVATSYIWVSLMAAYFFGDNLNLLRWIGIFVIITGIVFISKGSKEKESLKHVDVV